MALTQFEILGSGVDPIDTSTPNWQAAYNNIRDNNQAVDRYTNVALQDNMDNRQAVDGVPADFGPGGTNTTRGTNINLTQTFAPTVAGNYVFVGRDITLGGIGEIQTGALGVHIYFVNCGFDITRSSSTAANPVVGLNRAVNAGGHPSNPALAGATAANQVSVNFIGCYQTAGWTATGSNQNSITMCDFIKCSWDTVGSGDTILCGTAHNGGGSRWDDSIVNITPRGAGLNRIREYTTLTSARNLQLNGMAYEMTFGNFGQVLRRNAQFTNPYRGNRWNIQHTTAAVGDAMFQSVGYTNPSTTSDRNAILQTTAGGQNGNAYMITRNIPELNRGGMMNFYGILPTFQDIEGNGISGVKIKTKSSITLKAGNQTADAAVVGDVRTAITNESTTGITDRTVDTIDMNYENNFLSGTDGKITSVGASSQIVGTESNPVANTWFDMLRLGRVSSTGSSDARVLHQNFNNQREPSGETIFPVHNFRNNRVTLFKGAFLYRSTAYLVNETQKIISGVVGTDTNEFGPAAIVQVEEQTFNSARRLGWKFNSDGDPEAENTFGSAASRNYQEIFNHSVTTWSNGRNDSDVLVTVDGNTVVFPTGRNLFLNAASTTNLNSGATNTIQNTNDLKAGLSDDIITGIEVDGTLTLPDDASILQNTKANTIVWNGNAPSTPINGGNVDGTIELTSGNYTISNTDLDALTINKTGGGADVVITLGNGITGNASTFDTRNGTGVSLSSTLLMRNSDGNSGGNWHIQNVTNNTLIGEVSGTNVTISTVGSATINSNLASAVTAGNAIRVLYVNKQDNSYTIAGHILSSANTHTLSVGVNDLGEFPTTTYATPSGSTNVTGTTTVSQWTAGDYEIVSGNYPASFAGGGGGYVLTINVAGAGTSIGDINMSGYVADVIFANDTSVQNLLEVISREGIAVSDVYFSNGNGAVGTGTGEYLRFRSTQNQGYNLGFIANQSDDGTETSSSWTFVRTASSTDGTLMANFGLNFPVSPSNYDQVAASAATTAIIDGALQPIAKTTEITALDTVVDAVQSSVTDISTKVDGVQTGVNDIPTNVEHAAALQTVKGEIATDTNLILNKQFNERLVTADNQTDIGDFAGVDPDSTQTVTQP